MEDLRGKTVLLTGASSGLGPHIARRLHRAGAKFVLSARNQPALKKLAKELGESRVVAADLSLPDEPVRLAKEAGHVDVLVSNAGLPASGPLSGYTIEQLDRALAVNLRAGIVLAHELAPAMVKRKSGHMVFMCSVAGKLPTAAATLYHTTKYGLRGFGLALREELWGTGVGVSLVYPTFVSQAGMWAETGLKVNPMAGEVSPDQVAQAVWTAITKNRGEVDVAPLQVRAGFVAQALAPALYAMVSRSTGATRASDELTERQRSKR
ncbi:MAG TPA: SDR family NAD(P)-dependent oxidoreductase [Candidatus Sulfotelmatobacter sp.]|nr:SDR family NAD(P)-dependent oxidoreductase [Candidatus Sulfotelmatobacter sp.]